jgi:hypothetical protein
VKVIDASPSISSPSFDERFDAVKEKMQAVSAEQMEDLAMRFFPALSLKEVPGGVMLHTETLILNENDIIDQFLLIFVNGKLKASDKMPIRHVHVENFDRGICSVVGILGVKMIIKVDPSSLGKLKNSMEDFSQAASLIVEALGLMHFSFQNKKGDLQSQYLTELVQLWDMRFSESRDIKQLIFDDLLKTLSVRDMYEWNGTVVVSAGHCTNMELELFLKRAFRFLIVYHGDLSIESLKGELLGSDVSYEAVWKAALLSATIPLEHMLSAFPQLMAPLKKLGFDIQVRGHYVDRALVDPLLHELIDIWKGMDNAPESRQTVVNKVALFKIMLKAVISHNPNVDAAILIRTIMPLALIAEKEKYAILSHTYPSEDGPRQALQGVKQNVDEFGAKGMIACLPWKNQFVFMLEKGTEKEMLQLAASKLIFK